MSPHVRVGDSFLPVQGCASDITAIELQELMEAVDGMMDDPKGLLFDVTQGAYWYCIDNNADHGTDHLLTAASLLKYKPAPSEKGPDTEVSKAAYDKLTEMGQLQATHAVIALRGRIEMMFGRDD